MDENNLPVVGASVLVKNTVNGVSTGVDGSYTISLDDAASVLVFSFLGYTPQEVAVANRTRIDIQLLPDSKQVEEVVVVGYGVQKKESVVGAISTVDVANLKVSNAQLSTNLAGQLAGIVSMSRSGEPGKNSAADSTSAVFLRSKVRRRRWCWSMASNAIWTWSIRTTSLRSRSSRMLRLRPFTACVVPTV